MVPISPTELCGGELYRGRLYGPPKAKVPLCERHAAITYAHNTTTYRSMLAKEAERAGLTLDLPGWTYIIWLPNGRIKIGTSSSDENLVGRWINISRDYRRRGFFDGIRPIAIIPGGAAEEDRLHRRFRDFRVEDEYGEQFRAEPELIAYAEMYGIPEDKTHLVAEFEEAWARSDARNRKRLVVHAPAMRRRVPHQGRKNEEPTTPRPSKKPKKPIAPPDSVNGGSMTDDLPRETQETGEHGPRSSV